MVGSVGSAGVGAVAAMWQWAGHVCVHVWGQGQGVWWGMGWSQGLQVLQVYAALA